MMYDYSHLLIGESHHGMSTQNLFLSCQMDDCTFVCLLLSAPKRECVREGAECSRETNQNANRVRVGGVDKIYPLTKWHYIQITQGWGCCF